MKPIAFKNASLKPLRFDEAKRILKAFHKKQGDKDAGNQWRVYRNIGWEIGEKLATERLAGATNAEIRKRMDAFIRENIFGSPIIFKCRVIIMLEYARSVYFSRTYYGGKHG